MPRFRVRVLTAAASRTNPRALFELLDHIPRVESALEQTLRKIVKQIVVEVYGRARRTNIIPDTMNIYLRAADVTILHKYYCEIVEFLRGLAVKYEYIIDNNCCVDLTRLYRVEHAAYLLLDVLKQILAQARDVNTNSTITMRAG